VVVTEAALVCVPGSPYVAGGVVVFVVDCVVVWPGVVCVVVVEVVCAHMQTLSDSTETAAPSFENPFINFSFTPRVLFQFNRATARPESKMPVPPK
jgi:hypothetical protein